MSQLSRKGPFLQKYNLTEEDFRKTKLKWTHLKRIFEDHHSKKETLEDVAVSIFQKLMRKADVHSVRYRIKDPERLIAKIIRKKIEQPERNITISNYQTEITDLIGLRVLHLFKEQWFAIHKFITEFWVLYEPATAYFREGDNENYKKQFEENECVLEEHSRGYRSVHYIVKENIGRNEVFAEIQARTIFEEGWGEIHHTILYPYDLKNILFGQFLSILNRLAGSADEMGSFILLLQSEFQKNDQLLSKTALERDEAIAKLENIIKESQVSNSERKSMEELFDTLKKPIGHLLFPNFPLQNLSKETLNHLRTIDMSHFNFGALTYPFGGMDLHDWDVTMKRLTEKHPGFFNVPLIVQKEEEE